MAAPVLVTLVAVALGIAGVVTVIGAQRVPSNDIVESVQAFARFRAALVPVRVEPTRRRSIGRVRR